MQTMIKMFVAFLSLLVASVSATEQAKLVHNTLQEIDDSMGKMELQLIQTWGGEEEEDEHKFFNTPRSLIINNDRLVFICDESDNCIKVFDETGKYLRTIGQRGRGPGDLLDPSSLSFHPKSGLWVMEAMGRRVQCFDINGKSKAIFKMENFCYWLGVNSKNEIAIYGKANLIKSKRLLTVYNDKWELQREIGVYHGQSLSTITAEGVLFSIDPQDNYIAANLKTPVIRKYSIKGKLLTAITFETPYELPFKIALNEKGDEIKRIGRFKEESVTFDQKGSNVSFQAGSGKVRHNPLTNIALATDSHNRIYTIMQKRMLTDEERKGGSVLSANEKIVRSEMNWGLLENKDILRLLVFSPEGKVIAQVKIPSLCQRLYIHDDRLFLIDGNYNQRILEYKMIFK